MSRSRHELDELIKQIQGQGVGECIVLSFIVEMNKYELQ